MNYVGADLDKSKVVLTQTWPTCNLETRALVLDYSSFDAVVLAIAVNMAIKVCESRLSFKCNQSFCKHTSTYCNDNLLTLKVS